MSAFVKDPKLEAAALDRLAEHAFNLSELPGSEWLQRQLEAMHESKIRLEATLEHNHARAEQAGTMIADLRAQGLDLKAAAERARVDAEAARTALESGRAEFEKIKTRLVGERARMKTAGQELVARVKQDAEKLRRLTAELERVRKIAASLKEKHGQLEKQLAESSAALLAARAEAIELKREQAEARQAAWQARSAQTTAETALTRQNAERQALEDECRRLTQDRRLWEGRARTERATKLKLLADLQQLRAETARLRARRVVPVGGPVGGPAPPVQDLAASKAGAAPPPPTRAMTGPAKNDPAS